MCLKHGGHVVSHVYALRTYAVKLECILQLRSFEVMLSMLARGCSGKPIRETSTYA